MMPKKASEQGSEQVSKRDREIVRVPNKKTRRALKEVRARKNVETFEDISAWVSKMRRV
jgi:hypothetical protein